LRTPLIGAFAAAMAASGPFGQPPALAVAVSGGADSLCLALLARDWVEARNGSLLALVVDHGLRAESARKAIEVGWMDEMRMYEGIPPTSARDSTGTIEGLRGELVQVAAVCIAWIEGLDRERMAEAS
jgi:hypothetical protein